MQISYVYQLKTQNNPLKIYLTVKIFKKNKLVQLKILKNIKANLNTKS